VTSGLRPRRIHDPAKRCVDFLVAAAGLLVTAPLQAVITILVARSLGRPVVIRRQRPGRDAKPFTLIKLRSMRDPDPEAGLVTDADRLTPFGARLGGSSLDELMGCGLNRRQWCVKRTCDVVGASIGLLMFGWAIPILALVARFSSGGSGVFRQVRVGKRGEHFEILKLRTMLASSEEGTTVTASDDPRITRFGHFLRRTKLDELPQLINVLRGEMSLVGPRPDVPEVVTLVGEQAQLILSVPPGITGPATLVYFDEEDLLAAQPDKEEYNRVVLVPAKARINARYVQTWRLRTDLRYLVLTLLGVPLGRDEVMR